MPASDHNGPAGEKELQINVDLRLKAAAKDRDDTGDDLNLIVMLLTSILRFPSSASSAADKQYSNDRSFSYGSYLGSYRHKYGVDLTASAAQVKERMDEGIAGGWKPDASPALGAIRWYHRAETGANPMLAEVYSPIIHAYLDKTI
jgi:hypothetical protein